MSDRFNYDKAEADLYDSGCHHSEDIYGYLKTTADALLLLRALRQWGCRMTVMN